LILKINMKIPGFFSIIKKVLGILTFIKYKLDLICYPKPLSKLKNQSFFDYLTCKYIETKKFTHFVKSIHSSLRSDSNKLGHHKNVK